MNPSQIVKVARREYLTRVRSKAFIVMTVMIPVLMGGYIFIMPVLFTSSGTDELRIAVVDAETGLAPALADHLAAIEQPRVDVAEQAVVPDDSESVRQPYTEAVLDGSLDGYLVLTPDPVIGARSRYYARETGNPVMLRDIERAIEATLLDRLVAGTGVDTDALRVDLIVHSGSKKFSYFRSSLFQKLLTLLILEMVNKYTFVEVETDSIFLFLSV